MIGFAPLSDNFIFLVAFTMMGRICKKLLKCIERSVLPLCEHIQDSLRFQISGTGFWIPKPRIPGSTY